MVLTASSAYVKYGYESSYGTGTSKPHIFGNNQKISSLTWMTNMQELSQLDTPEIQGFVYGKNEGKCGVDYQMNNPWIFTSLFGDPTSSTTDDLTDHTWTSDPSDNATIRKIKTSNLQFGYNATLDEIVRNAKGAVTSNLTFKTSINNRVDVSQNLLWGMEDTIATSFTRPSDGINDGFFPYMFHNAKLELPSGTALGQVQDLELSFDTGAEQLYELGDASSVDAYRKLFKITGKFSMAVLDEANLQRVVDRVSVADLKIKLTNTMPDNEDDDEKSVEITLKTIGLGEHTVDFEPGEPVIENMTFQAGRATIVAKNHLSGQPASVDE